MGLRTSASSLDLAFAARPELKKYSAQIQKLDRDHNNEIELEDSTFGAERVKFVARVLIT